MICDVALDGSYDSLTQGLSIWKRTHGGQNYNPCCKITLSTLADK